MTSFGRKMQADAYQNGLAKLTTALHYSVPPVLGIVLVYVFVVDKTFGLFKLVGERVPRPIVAGLNAVYVFGNFAMISTAALFVCLRCELFERGVVAAPSTLRFEQAETCLPTVTVAMLLCMCTLWVDRAAIAFFSLTPSGNHGFRNRVFKGTTLSCAFMALAKNDPYAILLLLAYCVSRPSGLTTRHVKLKKLVKWTAVAVRMYVIWFGLVVLVVGDNDRVSRRSAGVVVLSALSSQFGV